MTPGSACSDLNARKGTASPTVTTPRDSASRRGSLRTTPTYCGGLLAVTPGFACSDPSARKGTASQTGPATRDSASRRGVLQNTPTYCGGLLAVTPGFACSDPTARKGAASPTGPAPRDFPAAGGSRGARQGPASPTGLLMSPVLGTPPRTRAARHGTTRRTAQRAARHAAHTARRRCRRCRRPRTRSRGAPRARGGVPRARAETPPRPPLERIRRGGEGPPKSIQSGRVRRGPPESSCR